MATVAKDAPDGTMIGFFVRRQFLCTTCADAATGPNPCPVYLINVRPYSQVCHNCGDLVVDGIKRKDGSPLSLFDGERP